MALRTLPREQVPPAEPAGTGRSPLRARGNTELPALPPRSPSASRGPAGQQRKVPVWGGEQKQQFTATSREGKDLLSPQARLSLGS